MKKEYWLEMCQTIKKQEPNITATRLIKRLSEISGYVETSCKEFYKQATKLGFSVKDNRKKGDIASSDKAKNRWAVILKEAKNLHKEKPNYFRDYKMTNFINKLNVRLKELEKENGLKLLGSNKTLADFLNKNLFKKCKKK